MRATQKNFTARTTLEDGLRGNQGSDSTRDHSSTTVGERFVATLMINNCAEKPENTGITSYKRE